MKAKKDDCYKSTAPRLPIMERQSQSKDYRSCDLAVDRGVDCNPRLRVSVHAEAIRCGRVPDLISRTSIKLNARVALPASETFLRYDCRTLPSVRDQRGE